MTRKYAPVLLTMWRDPDFRTLSPEAQRLYVVLLSDPQRSMVGVLPYRPRAWAATCDAVTEDAVVCALGELTVRRYVVADERTDEVLIRTMVKHDPPRGKAVTAMWRAWQRIESVPLRRAVLAEVPPDVWLLDPLARPPEADDLRPGCAE